MPAVAVMGGRMPASVLTGPGDIAPVVGMSIGAIRCFGAMADAAPDRIGAACGSPAVSVRRCCLLRPGALHAVPEGALGDGVTRSLALDARGTTPGGSLPALAIEPPAGCTPSYPPVFSRKFVCLRSAVR